MQSLIQKHVKLKLPFNESYYEIFNQHPQICENIKFHPKQKNILETKNVLFGCFGHQFWKSIIIFEISALKFAMFGAKNKNPLIWDQKYQTYVFCARIWTYYCHTWNQHPRIYLIPKLREMMKWLKLGPKISYLFFWGVARIFKKLFWYLKLAPSNLSNWKILQKKENV